jgi:hypothetical protein
MTIDRAFDGESILPEDVRVDLRRPDILVPEEFLDGPDICSVRQQVRGEGVPKRVTTGVLLDSQLSNGGANRFLEIRRIKVVSSSGAAPRINRRLCRGVDILPTPFAVRVRVLASQCIR